jgi:hypothetical protein
VHVSRSALENLHGAFEVEPGNGGDRDQFLFDYKVETFLIVGRTKPKASDQTAISSSESATTGNGKAKNVGKNRRGSKSRTAVSETSDALSKCDLGFCCMYAFVEMHMFVIISLGLPKSSLFLPGLIFFYLLCCLRSF